MAAQGYRVQAKWCFWCDMTIWKCLRGNHSLPSCLCQPAIKFYLKCDGVFLSCDRNTAAIFLRLEGLRIMISCKSLRNEIIFFTDIVEQVCVCVCACACATSMNVLNMCNPIQLWLKFVFIIAKFASHCSGIWKRESRTIFFKIALQ